MSVTKLWALGALPVLAFAAVPARADFEPAAQLKGYVAVNETLNERIARPDAPLALGTYLDDRYNPDNAGLLDLLGTYKGDGVDSEFQNGDPNVVNFVLYHVAFSGLAKDVAALCGPAAPDGSPAGPLGELVQPSFLAALKPLCAWPAPEAQAGDAMLGFWLALMSFDAPMSEYEAWSAFIRGPAFATAAAPAALKAMVLTVLDNPHFLLRK